MKFHGGFPERWFCEVGPMVPARNGSPVFPSGPLPWPPCLCCDSTNRWRSLTRRASITRDRQKPEFSNGLRVLTDPTVEMMEPARWYRAPAVESPRVLVERLESAGCWVLLDEEELHPGDRMVSNVQGRRQALSISRGLDRGEPPLLAGAECDAEQEDIHQGWLHATQPIRSSCGATNALRRSPTVVMARTGTAAPAVAARVAASVVPASWCWGRRRSPRTWC